MKTPKEPLDQSAGGAIDRALDRQRLGDWLHPVTAHTAAKALGIDPKTMVKALRDAGHEIGQNKTYSLTDVVKSVCGDLEAARTRLTNAEADIREMDRAEKRGDLVPVEKFKLMQGSLVLPILQRLNALASEQASRTNPTDPTHARAQLDLWSESTKAFIRERLPLDMGPVELLRSFLKQTPLLVAELRADKTLTAGLADAVETALASLHERLPAAPVDPTQPVPVPKPKRKPKKKAKRKK